MERFSLGPADLLERMPRIGSRGVPSENKLKSAAGLPTHGEPICPFGQLLPQSMRTGGFHHGINGLHGKQKFTGPECNRESHERREKRPKEGSAKHASRIAKDGQPTPPNTRTIDRMDDVMANKSVKAATSDKGVNFLVQCSGYRCLAYRDPEDQWRSSFHNEIITGEIEVIESMEASK